MRARLLFIACVLLLAVLVDACQAAKSSCVSYTTAASVSKAKLSSVKPRPQQCNGFDCNSLLSSLSCLGHYGPLGAGGPLGALGPLGYGYRGHYSKSETSYNWEEFREFLTKIGGPMSSLGPLGIAGPIGSAYNLLPNTNDFTLHLDGHGLWSALGPIGPLGALGPLGPLGPNGAHGYKRVAGGDYVDKNGELVTSLAIEYDAKKKNRRIFDLVEMYSGDRAAELSQSWSLDTSFVVVDQINTLGYSTTFRFKSRAPSQYVTLVLTPGTLHDVFALTLSDEHGNVIAESSTASFINTIQVYLSKPAKLQVTVRLVSANMWVWASRGYMLSVVGSTEHISASDITGDHIRSC